MSERTRLAVLLLAAVLVYINTLSNGFALDDRVYIVQNPAVTHFSLPVIFEPHPQANVFRPVTFASLALNWAIGGTHAWGYQAVNALLHALVALLLYFVFCKLLDPDSHGATLAWVASLLYAVHPIHTDAVASIIGRSELLAAAFLLGAWLLHLQDRPALSLLLFVAALLSKESAVVFVPLIFLGDYAHRKFKSVYTYASIAAVAVAYVAILWKIQGGRFGQKQVPFTENPLAFLPTDLRVLNALRVAWKYVVLQIFPAKLSCDYSFNSIPVYASWSHLAPAAFAALAVVLLCAWGLRSRRSQWGLAGAIYIAAFSVTANILIPTGTIMGERLAYLPSAGSCLFIALLWAWLEKRERTVAWSLLVVVLLTFGARTIVRNRDWRDNFTLFQAAERAVPANASIHDGLAGEYQQRGDWQAALAETDTTLSIYPDFPAELSSQNIPERDFRILNISAEHAKAGEYDDALAFLNLAIANSPNFSLAWSNRALVRFKRGELVLAGADAQTALRLDPANFQAHSVLNALSSTTPLPSHNQAPSTPR